MSITARTENVEKLKAESELQYFDDLGDFEGLTTLEDCEVNYALGIGPDEPGDLPLGTPLFGEHTAGGCYIGGLFAHDGFDCVVWVPADNDGFPLCPLDLNDGKPCQKTIADYKTYLEIRKSIEGKNDEN